MNKKQSKKLRRQAVELTMQWLRKVLPEDQQPLVTPESVKKFEAEQDSHIYANGRCLCSAYSTRFFYKKLKRAFYKGTDPKMFLVDKAALG